MNRKPQTLLVMALTGLMSFSAFAANFTQDNVTKTQALIDKTLEAYGGVEKIRNLNQLVVDYQVKNTNGGQSRKPEPPWDTSEGKRTTAFDFQNQITVTEFSGEGGGNRFAGKNIVNGDKSYNLNPLLKTKSKVEAADFETAAAPSLRSNGITILKRLQQYANSARYLGEYKHDGKKHDLIAFTMPGGPAITVYIDKKTHLINKTERVVGPFLVEYFFKDFRKQDGVLLPFHNSYDVNGEPSQTFIAKSYTINQTFESMTQIPDDYQDIGVAPSTAIKTTRLGDGVYWVTQNAQNSMFVEFADHVLMVGGLPGVNQRIEEIKKHIPDKPVKYTMMTHHHSDHIGGSQEVVDAGIKFIAAKGHEKVIRESLAEKDRKSAKFDLVKEKTVYSDERQLLEIYDIGPTPHTEHFLLAYLPKQGIIFEADHFLIPAAGPMPNSTPNIRRLVEAIEERQLKVKKIASAHASRIVTYKDLVASSRKQDTQKRVSQR